MKKAKVGDFVRSNRASMLNKRGIVLGKGYYSAGGDAKVRWNDGDVEIVHIRSLEVISEASDESR